MTPYQFE
jgi:hypothetical protein